MDVISKSIYLINNSDEQIETRTIPEAFNKYLENLINDINETTSVRKYKPRSQTTHVISLVKNTILETKLSDETKEQVEQNFRGIAEKLLQKEIEAQEQVNKLNIQIKRGSLVQALLREESSSTYIYLIAKVEHSEWIDDRDFMSKTGFPRNKRNIWKSCIFECSDEDNVTVDSAKIYVDGSAKYWHDGFLELDQMVNDEVNTDRAFKNIESILSRQIKIKSPNDYTVLRNSTIGYFRSNRHIDYTVMIDSIFMQYEPNNLTKEDISNLKLKLYELPNKKNFDCQFNSRPEVINARIRKIYPVTTGIELKITSHIDNIKETIQAIEESNGDKYIKIKATDSSTFNAFKA